MRHISEYINHLLIKSQLQAVSNLNIFSLIILSCYFIQIQVTKVL